jgi:cytochrome oxidase Cu insertion factor (SCO1/SenC/PrrC family)
MSQGSTQDRRQRRLLIGIALMFFAPLGLAFYLYYGHWHPGGRVNAGELIEPARPLPPLSLPLLVSGTPDKLQNTDPNFLKGKWTLLYVGSGPCAEECRRRLYDTRQVRLALDRDMDRVQRVFIADADCCDAQLLHAQHPDLIAIRAGAAAAPLLALLPGRDSLTAPHDLTATGASTPPGTPSAAGASAVYLIDPLGNLMMSYAADAKAKGMLNDIKRLLRLSSIG